MQACCLIPKKHTQKNSKLLSTLGQEQYITVSVTRVAGSTRSKCNSTGNLCCLIKSGPRPAIILSLFCSGWFLFHYFEWELKCEKWETRRENCSKWRFVVVWTDLCTKPAIADRTFLWLNVIGLLWCFCPVVLVIDDFLFGSDSSQLSQTTFSANC